MTSRLSERYLLMGNLGGGDVSLTIQRVEESDSGMYGCRVEIPGWFNDHKHQLTLTVVAGETHKNELMSLRGKVSILLVFVTTCKKRKNVLFKKLEQAHDWQMQSLL